MLEAIGARVLDEELPVTSAHQAFADDGGLIEPGIRSGLANVVHQLLHVTSAPACQPA